MTTASSSSASPLRVANATRRYEVTEADLPVSCPMPDMEIWNSHPRVYLSMSDSGEATCPYCAAEFRLKR